MLVLTRKAGETIVIGDNVRITIVEVSPGRVKMGIEAPRNVTVDRLEVRERRETETDKPAVVEVPPPVSLHNRISEQLPAPAEVPAREVPPSQLENRLKRVRIRKPR